MPDPLVMFPNSVPGYTVVKQRGTRFISTLEESRNRLWGAHVGVPDEVASRILKSGSRRVICILNSTVEYPTALMPRGDGSFVIRVNKQTRERLQLEYGSRLEIELRRDKSPYGLPMPEELHEVLLQDSDGHRLFHALTAGRQRTLLHLVGSPKRGETRVKRAVAVVRHLKSNHGKINYKQLNELLRGHWPLPGPDPLGSVILCSLIDPGFDGPDLLVIQGSNRSFLPLFLAHIQRHTVSERGVWTKFQDQVALTALPGDDRLPVPTALLEKLVRIKRELTWVVVVLCVAWEAVLLDYGKDIAGEADRVRSQGLAARSCAENSGLRFHSESDHHHTCAHYKNRASRWSHSSVIPEPDLEVEVNQ